MSTSINLNGINELDLSTSASFTTSVSAGVVTLTLPTTGSGNLVLAGSPTFTGTPTSPTAILGTSTTQVATTAFVQSSVGAIALAGDVTGATSSNAVSKIQGITVTGATGTNKVVFDTNPILVTPSLGIASATSLDISSKLSINSSGVISKYNSITTVGNGAPSLIATKDSEGLSAAITTETLYAVPSSGKGIYKVSYYLVVSQAATTSSAIQLTIGWTDSTGTAQTKTSSNIVANLVGAEDSNVFVLQVAASTNITDAIAYTSIGLTVEKYNIYLRIEAL